MLRKRVRQARADLLWGLAVFAALQLGLALAIEVYSPGLRDPNYTYKATRLAQRLAAAGPRPFSVVMLGSSRTVYGVKAGASEEALSRHLGRPVVTFNFGLYGAGPVMELLTLRRLLADGLRPDLLLVEVTPPLLAGQVPLHEVEAGCLPTDRLRRLDLALVKRYAGPLRKGLRREWWQAQLVPWHAHRAAIVSKLLPVLLPLGVRLDRFRDIDNSGYFDAIPWAVTPDMQRRAREGARREFDEYLSRFRLGGLACQGLGDLLAVCRREGIAAALVLMPEGPAFRSWYAPAAWGQVRAYLQGLNAEWEVPIIDAGEWVAEEDFLDSHHLLPRGAGRFTERFGREAVLPLVRAVKGPRGHGTAGCGLDRGSPLP
jgi:hypothetical protein